MYTLTNNRMDWMFNTPPCRHAYRAGNSFCAIGKLTAAIVGNDAFIDMTVDEGLTLYIPPTEADFMKELAEHLNTVGVTLTSISNINDRETGSLRDNHYSALKKLLSLAQETGFLYIEDSIATEFAKKLNEVSS